MSVKGFLSGVGARLIGASQIIGADGSLIKSSVPANNLITNGHFQENINGWNLYSNAAGPSPVTGSGGAPTLTTLRDTTSIYKLGYGALQINKPALNNQGQGVSYDFTMPAIGFGQQQEIRFAYQSSGVDNLFSFFLIDTAGPTVYAPTNNTLAGHGGTVGFTVISGTSSTYRLAIHCNSTSIAAGSLYINTAYVGLAQKAITGFTTSWVSGTSFVAIHNLNSRDVQVNVYDSVTFDVVSVDINKTSLNTITLSSISAPINPYTVVVSSPGASGTVLAAGGVGTVTSVNLTAPVEFTVSGAPISTNGTIAITKANQSANQIYSGPSSGVPAAPTFRSLAVTDLPPAIPASSIAAGGVGNTQFGYISGLTSDAQVQLNALSVPQTPYVNQYYYVSSQGNDTTGDGTYNKPFVTIAKAMGLILDSTTSKRYVIKIMGNKLQEPTNINLKPYVYIVGEHQDGSYVRINGGAGAVVPDASWGIIAGARTGIENVYFGGGSSLNWDLFSVGPNTGTPSCNLALNNVTFTGTTTYKGRAPGLDYLTSNLCYFFNNIVLEAVQSTAIATVYDGSTTVSATQAAVDGQYISCNFTSTLTLTASSTFINSQQINSCAIAGVLSLTDSASLITLTTDASSYPKHSQIVITGTPTTVFLSDAYGTSYTPVAPSNWPTVPTVVQSALDILIASIPKNKTAQWITSDGAVKTITHNFGTFNVMVQVLDNAGNYGNIIIDITRPTINTVVLTSSVAPGSAFTVLISSVLN